MSEMPPQPAVDPTLTLGNLRYLHHDTLVGPNAVPLPEAIPASDAGHAVVDDALRQYVSSATLMAQHEAGAHQDRGAPTLEQLNSPGGAYVASPYDLMGFGDDGFDSRLDMLDQLTVQRLLTDVARTGEALRKALREHPEALDAIVSIVNTADDRHDPNVVDPRIDPSRTPTAVAHVRGAARAHERATNEHSESLVHLSVQRQAAAAETQAEQARVAEAAEAARSRETPPEPTTRWGRRRAARAAQDAAAAEHPSASRLRRFQGLPATEAERRTQASQATTERRAAANAATLTTRAELARRRTQSTQEVARQTYRSDHQLTKGLIIIAREAYEERAELERGLLGTLEAISNANDAWEFGTATPNGWSEQDVRHASEGLDGIFAAAAALAPTDPLRTEIFAAAAQQGCRFYGRVAITANGSLPNAPKFTIDGGVQVTTGDGSQAVLYRDGSIEATNPETGTSERRYSDGSPWSPPAARIAVANDPARIGRVDHLTGAPEDVRVVTRYVERVTEAGQLPQAFQTSFTDWESNNNRHGEAIAAAVGERYTEMLEGQIPGLENQLQTVQQQLDGFDRDAAVAAYHAEHETDADDTDAQNAAETAIAAHLAALEQQRDITQATLWSTRANLNRTHYRLGVLNAPREGTSATPQVVMLTGGAVRYPHIRLNGAPVATGWDIYPDGRSILRDGSGTAHLFRANGERARANP